MSIDRKALFAELAAMEHGADVGPGTDGAEVSVPALVGAWLDAGPRILEGEDRSALESLCRQIDVRRKVSVAYGAGFARLDNESPAPPQVVSGLVAVLLANAAGVGRPGPGGALNDGWGLKCTNSAMKALDLRDDLPASPALRAWALETLDRARTIDSQGEVA